MSITFNFTVGLSYNFDKNFQRLCFLLGKKFILVRVQKGSKITIHNFLYFLFKLKKFIIFSALVKMLFPFSYDFCYFSFIFRFYY